MVEKVLTDRDPVWIDLELALAIHNDQLAGLAGIRNMAGPFDEAVLGTA